MLSQIISLFFILINLEQISTHKFLKTEACQMKANFAVIDECKFTDNSMTLKARLFLSIVKVEVSKGQN